MKPLTTIDKSALKTQTILDENGNKVAIILTVNQFEELWAKIAQLVNQIEAMPATTTDSSAPTASHPSNDKNALPVQLTVLQQHYDTLNYVVEDLRKYDDLPTELERKLLVQRLIKFIDTEQQTLRQQLTQVKKETRSATLHRVPALPPNLNIHHTLFKEIKTQLLAKAVNQQKPPIVIQAPSGTGKSVMVARLVRDSQVQNTFPDGIFWLTLGKDPDLLAHQIRVIHLLDETTTNVFNLEEGTNRLQELCATRAGLIVLDDVTDAQDILAFNIVSEYSQLLITSSEDKLADILQYFINTTKGYELRPFTTEPAIQFFCQCVGDNNLTPATAPPEVAEIVSTCAYLPLAIKLAANIARIQPLSTWQTLIDSLQDNSTEFPPQYPPVLMQALQLNIDTLGETADYYLALAVFIDYAHIPQSVVLMLWRYLYQLRDEESSKFIHELTEKALLHRNEIGKTKYLRLHSFQHDYLGEQVELEKLHNHLLAAYRRQCDQHGWVSGPNDGYFFEYLGIHLHHAGRLNELKLLLLDYDWLNNKLTATNIHALLDDYEWLDDKDTNIIKATLYDAAIVLHTNKIELANQLLDRLWDNPTVKNNKDIQALLNQAKEASPNWHWQPYFPD
jgi:DNA primase